MQEDLPAHNSANLVDTIVNADLKSLLPPEDFMGADKLFAEARVGSINGPLKLGARRTSRLAFSAIG